jgi:hypothetical protein
MFPQYVQIFQLEKVSFTKSCQADEFKPNRCLLFHDIIYLKINETALHCIRLHGMHCS